MKRPVIHPESSAKDVRKGLEDVLNAQRSFIKSVSEELVRMKEPPFDSSVFDSLRIERTKLLKEETRKVKELEALLTANITEDNKNDILDICNRIFGPARESSDSKS